MDLNVRQVEVFKAVMETGSGTEAASRLNVSQPSISKQLRLLEEALGFALFRRTGNRLIPTPEARALFDQIERVYTGLGHLAQFADDLRHHRHGGILVAAMPMIAHRWLPEIVGRFVAENGDASISLPVRSSAWVNQSVAAARVDLGVALAPTRDNRVVREPLLSLPLVCVLPPSHPLAERKVIKPRHLDGECLVTLSNFDQWRLAVERALDAEKIRLRRQVDTFTTYVACELSCQGVGVAIVDVLTAVHYAQQGLVFRPFRPRVSFEVFLLRPIHWPISDLAERFAATLRKEAKALQQWLSSVGRGA